MKKIISILGVSNIYLLGAVYDAIPTDYVAPKVGMHIASINLLQRDSIGPYSKGVKLTDDSISQTTYYLRYNYGSELGGFRTSYGVALPFTKLQTKGDTLGGFIGEKSTGWSDTVLNATLWLKADAKNKEYLATTFIVAVPTGKFDESQQLNSGENRYKYLLNFGYITPLNEKTTLELSPEFAFYGENKSTNGTIKQKPSYALNSNIRYKIDKNYEIFGGVQYSYNSETSNNGVEQNNDNSSNKYSLGAFYYTQNYNQFMVRYGKEESKEFGMTIKDEVLLRYRWWF
jgi:hypothetical protein